MSTVLVLGGARSGKSALAERLTRAGGAMPLYIATAQAWDDEMRARIAEHRAQRDGLGWTTVEAPLALADALAAAPAGQPVLIDCLTLWLTNLMLGEHPVDQATAALLETLTARPGLTVLVANEVGLGIVPDNALARRFRDLAGRLNQQIATQADTVVFTAAGLPLLLKGQLPAP